MPAVRPALVIDTDAGLAGLAFADDGQEKAALVDMRSRWPGAPISRTGSRPRPCRAHLQAETWRKDQPLRVVLIGTDFEIRVWETLLHIPMGALRPIPISPRKIGKPKAARAVGVAVGRNPISFVVPCHRVHRQSPAT